MDEGSDYGYIETGRYKPFDSRTVNSLVKKGLIKADNPVEGVYLVTFTKKGKEMFEPKFDPVTPSVSTKSYEVNHSARPYGKGQWAFEIGDEEVWFPGGVGYAELDRRNRSSEYKPGETVTTYSDAKRQAIAYAKKKQKDTKKKIHSIKVLP
jgi:hypothetical protein